MVIPRNTPSYPSYSLLLAALLALGLCGCEVSDRLDQAHALDKQRRWKEAVDAYKDVLRKYPNSYEAAWGIGRIYCHEVHLYDGCLKWTEPLLEAHPRESKYLRARAAGLRDRAAAYRESGEPDKAAADEAAADALAPPN